MNRIICAFSVTIICLVLVNHMNPIVVAVSVVGGMVALALLSKWSGALAAEKESAAAKAEKEAVRERALRLELSDKLLVSAQHWASMPTRNSVVLKLLHSAYASAILSAADEIRIDAPDTKADELQSRMRLHQQQSLREVRESAPQLLP
jgi:hypothetical protein